MRKLAEGLQPKATTDATKWALKTFEQWSQDRNFSGCGAVPSTLLITEDVSVLSKYLSLFVVEARKKEWRKISSYNSSPNFVWHPTTHATT